MRTEPLPPVLAALPSVRKGGEPAALAPGRRLPARVLTALFLASLFLPVILFEGDKYWLPLFTRYMALALFALSVDLIWGYTGLLSLGHGLYFGIGMYAVAYSLKLQKALADAGGLREDGSLPLPDFMAWCRLEAVPSWIAPLFNIWVALAVALLLPAAVATLFGLVTFRLRIKGVYFSLITQALVLALFTLVDNQQPYTGGRVGMPYLAKLELFGKPLVMENLFLVITGALVVCFVGCALLMESKFGKILTAIRDNENRVLALGYPTAMYKTFIFALSGLIAGLSGALYTAAAGTAGPDPYLGIAFSIEVVILVAVGGRGTLVGAVLGAILVNFLKTYANDEWKGWWPIILGSLFIGVTVFMPEGIIGTLSKASRAALRRIGVGWLR